MSLQHTATHCNTLQHMSICNRRRKTSAEHATATDCNRLQQTATDCNRLQQTATQCNRLQQTATDCNTVQQTATDRNRLQHSATDCNRLQQTATDCNTFILGTDGALRRQGMSLCLLKALHPACCSVLQCIAVCCSVFQRFAVRVCRFDC